MELSKRQKRELFIPNCVHMREQGVEANADVIDAVAIVSNVETILYEDDDVREIEAIAPTCIRQAFLDSQNSLINLFHKYVTTFARSSKFGGTAVISEREGQVAFVVPANESIVSKHARDLIANGTINGCSFEFWPKLYTIEHRTGADGKREVVFTHTEFEAIEAYTLAARPAYPTTSVRLRELYGITDETDQDAEAKKREAEEQAAKEEAERKAAEEAAKEHEEREAQEKAEREKFTRERSLREIQIDLMAANAGEDD